MVKSTPFLSPTYTVPNHFRVKKAAQKNLMKLIGKHLWWSSLSLELGNVTLQLKNSIRDFFSVNFDTSLWDFTSILKAITPANFRLDEEEYTHLSHTSWEDVLKKISQVLVFHNNNNNFFYSLKRKRFYKVIYILYIDYLHLILPYIVTLYLHLYIYVYCVETINLKQ